MTEVSNAEQVIDSRDVIARIKELTEGRESLIQAAQEFVPDEPAGELQTAAAEAVKAGDFGVAADAFEDAGMERAAEACRAADDWMSDYEEEWKSLLNLQDEAAGRGDWEHGTTLVREDYWVDYVREMLQDIGDLPKDLPGYLVIDWGATADNIAADYSQVDFGGVTYYVRD